MKKIRRKLNEKFRNSGCVKCLRNKKGMEMVQVAILVGIAVAVGIIFKGSVTDFVNKIFSNLNAANF